MDNKAAIEELSTLGAEELARRLLSARDSIKHIEKARDEQRSISARLDATIDTVIHLLWIEVCETDPKIGRNDVISIANRARELLRIGREQREMPF